MFQGTIHFLWALTEFLVGLFQVLTLLLFFLSLRERMFTEG
jgi:preprotein translocase subunit SecG